ncbi:hypothetical protein [Roseibium marinum]|uniref:Uncharacterized protein n=1 Tax=Roseibium marinum TaxID=281252 RepID=A0A2S3URT5_9HYPH|nr:hypothetical protein [Roseibium marinum]POF30431.1 hypothetical protein CLV41_10643 [Roseibium marinum]
MSLNIASPRDVIITAVSGYEPKHLAVWYNSLKAVGFKGRTLVVAYDVSEALVEYMTHMGSIVITFDHDEKKRRYSYSQLKEEIEDRTEEGRIYTDRRWTWNKRILRFKDKIYDRRFFHAGHLVRKRLEALGEPIRFVAFSDSRDVVFQGEPFSWMAENLASDRDLLVGEESITHQDPWNRRNVLKTYGHHALERVENQPVCCAGYFAGRYDAMMDFMLAVYYFDQTKRSGDQAAFNQLLTFAGWKEKTARVNWQVPWLLHAVSANVSPQVKSFCMPADSVPVFEDGVVMTSDKQPYAIVHQYDRNKEMTAHFLEKFGEVE